MPSTIHILETALVILAAFLVGCVVGYLARRLTAGKLVSASVSENTAAVPTGPQLVVAPVIAPLSRGQTPAQRLAAAAAGAKPSAAETSPTSDSMRPARVAGQATSGREIARPKAPPPAEVVVSPPSEVLAQPLEVAAAVAELRAAAEAAIPAESAVAEKSDASAESDTLVEAGTPAGTTPIKAELPTEIVEAPVVEPEPEPEIIRLEDVPQIDEAAHVADVPAPVSAEDVPPIDEMAHVVDAADASIGEPQIAPPPRPDEPSTAPPAELELSEIVTDREPVPDVERTPLPIPAPVENAPPPTNAMQVVEGTAPPASRLNGADNSRPDGPTPEAPISSVSDELPVPAQLQEQPVAQEPVVLPQMVDAAFVVEGRASEPEEVEPLAEADVPDGVAPPDEDAPLVVANNGAPDIFPAGEATAEGPVASEASGEEYSDTAAELPTTPEPMPPPPSAHDEDAEAAAMRAIEGGWTPRVTVGAQQPAPQPDLAPGEIEAAMSSARSAVASAAAAAEVAVSLAAQAAADDEAPQADIDFERAGPQAESGALVGAHHTHTPAPDGLDFEPERPLAGFGRPDTLPAPRGDLSDDLRRIKGVTPDLANALNRIGIFHFDQIAGWDQKAVVWLDHHLSLRGRIGREKWVEQARSLIAPRPQAARPIKR